MGALAKKLRDLEQHVMAASACIKEIRDMKEETMSEDDENVGDIGGGKTSVDDDDMAGSSLKMKLSKYK